MASAHAEADLMSIPFGSSTRFTRFVFRSYAYSVVEPSLSALAEGYTVHAVINASGTYSEAAQRAAVERLTRAGVIITDVEGVISEWQHTWNRQDALDWAALHAAVMPPYAALIESVTRAQAEALGTEGANAELKHARQSTAA